MKLLAHRSGCSINSRPEIEFPITSKNPSGGGTTSRSGPLQAVSLVSDKFPIAGITLCTQPVLQGGWPFINEQARAHFTRVPRVACYL